MIIRIQDLAGIEAENFEQNDILSLHGINFPSLEQRLWILQMNGWMDYLNLQ